MIDEELREVVALLYNAVANLANQSQNYNKELVEILTEAHKIIVVSIVGEEEE